MARRPFAVSGVLNADVQHVLRRRIDEDEPAPLVGHDDAIAHAVENRLQDPRLLLQRSLGARQLLGALLGGGAALGDARSSVALSVFSSSWARRRSVDLLLELGAYAG